MTCSCAAAPEGASRQAAARRGGDQGSLAAHATRTRRQRGRLRRTGGTLDDMPLSAFTPTVREWFERSFAEPTAAQAQAWPAIATGEHVLISAPTGSGKTLAAFLWGLDRLSREPADHTRLVYVSPLKALAYDVDRNLRAPLRGIGADLTVGIRTGDTPQRERMAMRRTPPDILITTPESLYLMLTSQARAMLEGVEAVIVDEIHAVAGTKRGAHLALTLERLAALQPDGHDPQRIGLSATQNPLEEVGRFMVGPRRKATIVDAGVRKELDLRIQVPVESMVEPEQSTVGARPARSAGRRRGDAQVDLAGDLPRAARARARAPLDDHLRQRPPRRRAPGAAPQRAGQRRPAGGRLAGGDRARAPRLARPRGAHRRRGAAEGRRAPVPGRDLVAGAGHRHGRRRPRAAGRVAQVRRRRPAAHRPRRPQRRRRRPRAGSSRSSAPTCSSRRSWPSSCARAASSRPSCRATRSTCSPSRSSRSPPAPRRTTARARRRRRPVRARHAHALLRRAVARAAGERARHARRPLPVAGVRRAAPADRVGPRRRDDPRAQGLAPARGDQRRHDPRPRAVLRRRCPTGAASASSTRRWSTRRARARRSCSAPRRGASRTSAATA